MIKYILPPKCGGCMHNKLELIVSQNEAASFGNLCRSATDANAPDWRITMKEPVKVEMDGKQVRIFRCEMQNAPIVYANMYMEAGRDVLTECEKLGCGPFHLVSISKLRWDEELSPWAHEPVVSKNDRFTGEANEYVQCLTEQIIPYAEKKTGAPSCRMIAGYSMGGLFALYAPYVTDAFSASVSASGSVWYPGFTEYVRTHDFRKKPDAVYLSLGDLESRTKNRFLCQAGHCTEALYSVYQQQEIPVVFEINPGNHYQDANLRLSKGIRWTLDHLSA